MKRRSFFGCVLAAICSPVAGRPARDADLDQWSRSSSLITRSYPRMRWARPSQPGGSWHDPTCWEPQGVPGPETDVLIEIPDGTFTRDGVVVDVTGRAEGRDLTFGESARVYVRRRGHLTVNGNIEVR